ncbi:NAD(P)H-dependent oxidoreductase [Terrarubrum flagellatum]|uniref:NADPH-dependent FMN reductase n=1 Tax=Terrirubrum flagellatum TaxID=2895980 RepID=UPI003144F504
MALKLQTIITSTRPVRIGPAVGAWFHEAAVQHGKFDASLIDLVSFNLPLFDEPEHPRMQKYQHEHTKKWSASVDSADAFVFVVPEYNYAPPPSFVNAVTYLSKEWNYKPVGFVGYGGVSGGLRSIQPARLMLTSLKMMPIPEGVPIPGVFGMLDAEKKFKPNDLISTGAKTMLDELHRWAEALKPLRG